MKKEKLNSKPGFEIVEEDDYGITLKSNNNLKEKTETHAGVKNVRLAYFPINLFEKIDKLILANKITN